MGTLIEGSIPSITDLKLAFKKSILFIWIIITGVVIYISKT
jgi:hypothetical protein